MAENVYIRPPDAMNVGGGNPSDAWDKWKLKFQIFLRATGANGKGDHEGRTSLIVSVMKELKFFPNFPYLPERLDPDDRN